MNASISVAGIAASPEQIGERDRELVEPAFSSKLPPSGCVLGASLPPVVTPPVLGPWLAMPRRLSVTIGSFMGWSSPVIRLSSALSNAPGC